MSADSYRDCPVCNVSDAVPIYGLFGYELCEDGSMKINMSGTCTACGAEYGCKV